MKNTDKKSDVTTLRQKAEEMLEKTSLKTTSHLSEIEIVNLVHELEVHQIELEMQYNELLLAKEKEEAAFEKYTELYDFAPTGYFTLSREGEIIGLNLSGGDMLGMDRSRLLCKRFGYFVSDETKPTFTLFLDKIFYNKAKEICEVILSVDGKLPISVHLNGTISENEEQCFITAVDITKHKLTEEALRESEKFLKETQTIAQLGAYSFDIISGKWSSSEVLDSIYGIDANFDKSVEGWAAIIHPEWSQIMLDYFNNEVIGNKVKFDKVYKIIRQKDKEERWVHGLGELLFNDKNEPIKMIGTIQDITERQHTDEKLRQLSQAVEQSPVSIIITDTTGAIQYVNPKFLQINGYRFEEVIGKNPRFLNSGLTSSEEYEELWKTLQEGNEWHGEFHNKRKDGSLYWESASISPILNAQGITTHYIAIKEDITERKLAEEELIKTKELAEEKDRLKSAFLANMSHEIRTPMNGILGFTELLKEPNLKLEEQQEYVRIIQESGIRMLNIINDIIDISKIESKQMKISITETNINDKIEYIFNFFKPEITNKGIHLSYKNGLPSKESIINTDSEKVYAILTNLVKNAIKFTDKGNIEFGYALKANNKPAELEFFVKDTGVGVPKDRQQAIFDRFIQANVLDKRSFQGAGLGLSISKAYTEMLGGKIWIESEDGKGSSFYFTIPYNTELKKDSGIDTIILENQEENQIKNLKILIVEDDKISNMLITKAIKTFSEEVLQATIGVEAVEICRNNADIDLVLMDVNMPVMDGHEATRQIRQFNKNVIIIAQTAYGMSSDREDAIVAGCNDYISKPINIAVLSGLIQTYFKNKREINSLS